MVDGFSQDDRFDESSIEIVSCEFFDVLSATEKIVLVSFRVVSV